MDESRYIVYGRSTCSFCVRACELLAEVSAPTIFFDHCNDLQFLEEVKSFYSFPTVPIILANNITTGQTRFVGGYSDLREVLCPDEK